MVQSDVQTSLILRILTICALLLGLQISAFPQDDNSPATAGERPAAGGKRPIRNRAQLIEQKRKALRQELENLSQKDQRQLRRALKKVWSNKDLAAARDEYRKAGQRYQRSLHSALMKEDEDLRPILERLLEAGLDAPIPQQGEILARISRNLNIPVRKLAPMRAELLRAYQKANRSPEVVALRKKLPEAKEAERKDLNDQIRKMIRANLIESVPQIKNLK